MRPQAITGSDSAITVDSVTVSAGAVRILDLLSVTVGSGSFVGICGPNGSGKSTLLRCLHRAVRPHLGMVLVGGVDIASLRTRQLALDIAVVAQERSGDLDFTVREMVAMGRRPHRGLLDPFSASDQSEVDRAIERVDLSALSSRSFRTLSGGERQRALIARALAQQTPLLLLDEPTNHLDTRHQVELLELIRSLRITVVAALHDLQLAARFCDQVHLLSRGRLIVGGSPADVLTSKNLRRVYGVDVEVHDVGGRLFFDYQTAVHEQGPAGTPQETT